jgi:hypothetical protein
MSGETSAPRGPRSRDGTAQGRALEGRAARGADARRGAGDRWVEVSPSRFPGWVTGFGERHRGIAAVAFDGSVDSARPDVLTLRGGDGATAACHPPFPPVTAFPPAREAPADSAAGAEDASDVDALATDAAAVDALAAAVAAHAAVDRSIGVLLVRRGGYAIGLFHGERLTASKVGSRYVQGRSKAGGWSQQRFARRREGQAAQLVGAAADAALRLLVPSAAGLDGVLLGGDTLLLGDLRQDRRLAALWPLVAERQLDVADPRLDVLRECGRRARAVRIRIHEP